MSQRQFSLAKQVTFALAATLTAVAREAQAASVASIENTFTVRNSWDKPSNARGVKALPASKDDLSSAVASRADWLIDHEEGETKTPMRAGGLLAIPTSDVRRSKRDIIQRSQRPKALGAKAFVVKTRNGPVLAYPRGGGKNKQLVS